MAVALFDAYGRPRGHPKHGQPAILGPELELEPELENVDAVGGTSPQISSWFRPM